MRQILLISEVAVWAKSKKREKKNRKKSGSSHAASSHHRSTANDSTKDMNLSSTMKTFATMREEAFHLASSRAEANNTTSATAAATSDTTSVGGIKTSTIFGAFFGEQDHTDLSDQLVKWEEPSSKSNDNDDVREDKRFHRK